MELTRLFGREINENLFFGKILILYRKHIRIYILNNTVI